MPEIGFFLKWKISIHFFSSKTLKVKLKIFFKILNHIVKTVLSQFFVYVFCAKLRDETQKKLLKTEHQCKISVKLGF